MRQLLLVEDDDDVADALGQMLTRAGFEVRLCSSGADALLSFREATLVLLDIGLPDIDGVELCRRIRSESMVPIVILSARSEEIDKVLGLRMGADDYLVKPYSFQELLARIEAVLRRAEPQVAQAKPPSAAPESGLTVNPLLHRAWVDDREVALSRKEFGILALLAERPGAVVSRASLLATVWGPEWSSAHRTLDVHVSSLRAKLGRDDLIEVVRGVGYRLSS